MNRAQVMAIDTIVLPVLGEMKPWQLTFLAVGLPGLLIALLFILVVKEPLRTGSIKEEDTSETLSLRNAARYVFDP